MKIYYIDYTYDGAEDCRDTFKSKRDANRRLNELKKVQADHRKQYNSDLFSYMGEVDVINLPISAEGLLLAFRRGL